MSDEAPLVLVRGAGDFASGIIHRLHRAGFQVVATELARPLAVRRRVAFSEAVHEGRATVEGVTAVRCGPGEIDGVLRAGNVALLVDPDGDILGKRQFDIVVDARSAKRNLGTRIDDAPIVVAIGPGFHAGRDCHAVVETLLGAGIGRVILDGPAADDSGQPTPLEGGACAGAPTCVSACNCSTEYVGSLVIRAPKAGKFRLGRDIGSELKRGDIVGNVEWVGGDPAEVTAGSDGLLRGIMRDGTTVHENEKLGDIDPTMDRTHLARISEKARSIAGGVLEAALLLRQKGPGHKMEDGQ